MDNYLIFFLIVYILLALVFFVKESEKVLILVLVLFAMTFFSAGNTGQGSDYFSYKQIYEGNDSGKSFQDIGFYLIVNLCNYLDITFDSFIIIISAISSILLFTLISSIDKKIIFLMIYISGYFLYFQFNAIKQGLSILIFLVGILCKNQKLKNSILISSITIHTSQLLTLLLYYLDKNFVRYALLLIPVTYLMFDYYAPYIDHEIIPITKSIYPTLIFKALFSLWLLKFNCSKLLIFSEIACTIFIHLGYIYISRYVDVIFLLIVFEFCTKKIKIKYIDYFPIIILIAILQLGSLNIIYSDCDLGNNIWCNY